MFFDLIKHIEENYIHYRNMYQFKTSVYRNDFAFSIAVHIMNGYQTGNFVGKIRKNTEASKIRNFSLTPLLEQLFYRV